MPAVISQMQAISKDYYSTCNYMDIVKVFYNKDMFFKGRSIRHSGNLE